MHNHEPMPLRMLAWLAFCATIAWLGLHWREFIAISPDGTSTPTQQQNTFVLSVCGPDNSNRDPVAGDTLARCNVRFETRGFQRDDNCERISYLVELNGQKKLIR